jgi:hypothetical protein
MKKLVILISLMSFACMDSNLPIYTELNSLRILALVSSNPEVDAGGSTTITPILSDITETSALNFVAEACIPLTSSDSSCEGNSTKVSVSSGTLNSGQMTAARSFTGAATAVNVTVPASGTIYANRTSQDQFNGITYLFTYRVINSAGQSVSSFKRIIVSTRTPKNQNPILNDVLRDGAVFTSSLPLSEVNLSPSFGATTTETYSVINSRGETRTESESLTTTWFATDGKFKFYRTLSSDTNLYTGPESSPTSRDAFLLAVTRDGRGGISFARKCFGTCP